MLLILLVDHSFYGCLVFHCMDTLQSVPVDGHLGCFQVSTIIRCYEHLCIRLFVDICFSLADWVTARSGISGS